MGTYKKKYLFTVIIIILGYLFYPISGVNKIFAGIENSHHDFSNRSWSNGEICRPCHVPHNVITDEPNSPLWSHTLSSAYYDVYSSSTINSVIGQPTGKSKLWHRCFG